VRQNSRVYIHQRSGSANPRFLSPLLPFSSVGQQSHRPYHIRNHLCQHLPSLRLTRSNIQLSTFNFRLGEHVHLHFRNHSTHRTLLPLITIDRFTHFCNHHIALKYLYTGTVSESLFGQTSRHIVTYKRASFDTTSIHRAFSLDFFQNQHIAASPFLFQIIRCYGTLSSPHH